MSEAHLCVDLCHVHVSTHVAIAVEPKGMIDDLRSSSLADYTCVDCQLCIVLTLQLYTTDKGAQDAT